MRPPGPEPLRPFSSIPASPARRRASGEAGMRAPAAGEVRCRRGCRSRRRLLRFRDGRRCRLRRRSTRRRLCPAGRQAPQRRADGKLRPLRRQDGFQGAVRRRLDLDRGLVGLELDQRLALAHALAGLFQPAQHLGRFHRRAELGNQKVHRGASLKHDPFKQNHSLPSFPRALPLYRALKRERVAAEAQRRRPGEGRTSDHACRTLTPHRFAMGPPLPLRSAGEGKLGAKTDVITAAT